LIGTQIMGEFGPLVTLRVALASGLAFLCAQMLDVTIFDRLRAAQWWKAPLISTLFGSVLDTSIFFSIAFATAFTFLDPANDVAWANEAIPLMGVGPMAPLWMSLALADWCVKFTLALIALLPFRAIVTKLSPRLA
jgi:queuosine precursor transporter